MPDIVAFYTGNLKSENMPIYGPNLDLPFDSDRASGLIVVAPRAPARRSSGTGES